MSARHRCHAAKLRPGSKLWPALELLIDRGTKGATTSELDKALNPDPENRIVQNPSAAMCDIRKRAPEVGWFIPPGVCEGSTRHGSKVYRYYAREIAKQNSDDRANPVRPLPPPRACTPDGVLFDARPIKPH